MKLQSPLAELMGRDDRIVRTMEFSDNRTIMERINEIFTDPVFFFLVVKSYNSSSNVSNREELYSFYASNQRGPFSNATKVSA